MSYQVFYGDGVAIAGCDLHANETNMYSEQFSTEFEALHRARELLDGDAGTVVVFPSGVGRPSMKRRDRGGFAHRRRGGERKCPPTRLWAQTSDGDTARGRSL